MRQSASARYPEPTSERVSDRLFQTYLFFDPRDLLQVKYEMLGRVVIDGQPIGSTCVGYIAYPSGSV